MFLSRRTASLSILAVVTCLPARAATISAEGMLTQINTQRKKKNRKPLTLDPRLTKAAQAHAVELQSRGYGRKDIGGSGHLSKNGATVADRTKAARYRFKKLAENIAYNTNGQQVVEQWIASKGHNRNLLDRDVRDCGIGISGDVYVLKLARQL
ncbi:MAG: CAP domain-containing protein [Pseudomonadota bacterium]